MLSNLFEVYKGIFQTSADGSHTAQSRPLELLALEERLRIFQKPHIIPRYGLDEMFRRGELPKGDAEVVRIVESVQKVLVCKPSVSRARHTLLRCLARGAAASSYG